MYIGKDSQSGKDRACAHIQALSPDRAWTMETKPYRKAKSREQVNYWWGVVARIIADETGHTPQEIHDYLCEEIFGATIVEVMGKPQKRLNRTITYPKMMTTEEMSGFTERCCAWAATTLGIIIPSPNE